MTVFSENRPAAPVYRWEPDYAVGVEEIDREHQWLFALAEGMHQAMLSGKGRDALQALLTELVDYTASHFSHEEGLMERSGYPDLRGHRRQHEDLRARVREMQDRASSGEETMTIEVMQFFIAWLKQHTSTSDRRIGEHLKATGQLPGRAERDAEG